MNRTEAREYLMQILFQMEMQKDFTSEAVDRYFELNIEEDDIAQKKYIKDVCITYEHNKEKIDSLIEEYSKGWKLSRIGKVDLAVMRLCISEALFLEGFEKTPEGAALNEAVKLVKKYGSENSGKFVNGVLGEIFRNYKG